MQFVKDITEVTSKCNRVQGLQKLKVSGLLISSPIKVIVPSAFKTYLKKHKLISDAQQEIVTAFKEIRSQNPHRGVYIGRAYYVPGIKHPPGPRSSSVTSWEVALKEVIKLYEFAISNHFNVKNSEIGIILYPYINPRIPYGGGCITPDVDKQNTAVIEAIYGVDEGVQSFSHDTYWVDLEKKEIVKKVIEEKKQCLEVSDELSYETKTVPDKLRNSQVLRDEDILTTACDYKKFVTQFGKHRLEFASQIEGIYFRECVPFYQVGQKSIEMQIKDKILKISSSAEIKKVSKNHRIIYIDPKIIQKRNMDLLTSLAFNIPHKKIILYPGSASTAHAATILRERGHVLVFVGNKKFNTGQKVKIGLKNGELIAEITN